MVEEGNSTSIEEDNVETIDAAFHADARFYVRYDNTVPDEDGTTHYNNAKYFPIGDEMNDDRVDTSNDDYDGEVLTNDAYVAGAESIIIKGNVNLYDSFDGDLKKYFNIVYNNIEVLPKTTVIKDSINGALGGDWAALYENGKIDVLWYVIKQEPGAIHVDGVLYNIGTGKTVDIGTDIPEEPVVPDERKDPKGDDGSDESGLPEDEGNNPKSEEQSSGEDIVIIEDNPTPLASPSDIATLPQTGDYGDYILLLCAGCLIAVCAVRWYLDGKSDKNNSGQ